MKLFTKILILICSSMLSTISYADCPEGYFVVCIYDAEQDCVRPTYREECEADVDDGEVLVGLVVLGFLYNYAFLSGDESQNSSRKINDFTLGRGYRLTSYDNKLNISLLSVEFTQQNFESEFKYDFRTNREPELQLNLIKFYHEWN